MGHYLRFSVLGKWRGAVGSATKDWIESNNNGQAIYDAFKAGLSKYPDAF
jgi:hypothetical protein